MQEAYVIRITACHKPWRYSSTIYTTNKRLFEVIKLEENQFIETVNWSNYSGEGSEDFDYYDALDEGSVDPIFPLIILGEVEVYTE